MTKIKSVTFILLTVWVILFLSCSTPQDQKYVRNGKQYGIVEGLFRHRWWNFYERGMSFEKGKFWKEAVRDFKEALKQRDKDQRAARTYGMHFVDYFPHRELGTAYFYLGKLEEAEEELEISLSTVDTAKAKFYLNKVRKALLEVSKEDKAPPKLRIATVYKKVKVPPEFRVRPVDKEEEKRPKVIVPPVPRAKPAPPKVSPPPSVKKKPIPPKEVAPPAVKEKRAPPKGITPPVVKKRPTPRRIIAPPIVKETSKPVMPKQIPLPVVYEEVTNNFNIKIEGEVEDDSYAHKVEINEDPLFIELSAKKIKFSKDIKLKKGLNEIKIKTSDLLGKVTEKKVKIIADFEGPLLNIKNYVDGQQVPENKIVLNGALADATGITTLKINDQMLAYNKEREVEFSFAVDLKEGNNKVVLAATDIAGNTTRGELNLVYVPKLARERPSFEDSSTLAYYHRRPILLALRGSGIVDTGQNLLFSAATPESKKAAFRLTLKDLTDKQTVYFDTIYVDGSVTATNKVESVMINGSPLVIIPGRTIYFSQVMQLKEGENRFRIDVEDAKGNRESKTVDIIRKIQKVHQIGSRMSLAILPFVAKGEISLAGRSVYDNILDAFLDQDRFNIVTRGDELEAVLRELKLSKTKLVDRSTAVKIGKLVAAEGILMGTIHETRNSIEIYARLINTETSTLLEAKDVYGQIKSLSQIQYLTNGLALKFKHSFPLLEGLVIKVSGKNIYADFGSLDRIKKEMKFIVFREGEKVVHPVTGKLLGSETEELGVATVVRLFDEMSIGKLIANFDPSNIQVQDLIITK